MARAVEAFLLALGHREMMLLVAAMAVLIFWRHRANIQRLAQGREPRIGKKG